ncbi:hypothetical protein [Rhizobacter sp. J219]
MFRHLNAGKTLHRLDLRTPEGVAGLHTLRRTPTCWSKASGPA